MKFALLTLLSALSLAAVADWFSIVGFMAIYAAMPVQALIMGAVLAAAKLITTSWVYRNWKFASLRLRLPLIGFVLVLMTITSIGTYGFLSKAHLEQGASTIDNSAKVERLDQQISREKSVIADDEKVIAQLDGAINSYIDKNRADRSLYVRKQQAPQRQQLRDDIDAAQKRIDGFSNEKLLLQSEVRKQQLDVGPIRYIAELFYGVTEDPTKNIESAVRFFTLLIVLTLDPLAVILLIAANHTLLRIKGERKKNLSEKDFVSSDKIPEKLPEHGKIFPEISEDFVNEGKIDIKKENNITSTAPEMVQQQAGCIECLTQGLDDSIFHETTCPEIQSETEIEAEPVNEKETISKTDSDDKSNDESGKNEQEETETASVDIVPESYLEIYYQKNPKIHKIPPGDIINTQGIEKSLPIIRSPAYTQVDKPADEPADEIEDDLPIPTNIAPKKININTLQDSVIRELRGNIPHFIPQKVYEVEKEDTKNSESDGKNAEYESEATRAEAASSKVEEIFTEGSAPSAHDTQISNDDIRVPPKDPISHPLRLSWLTEFRRS